MLNLLLQAASIILLVAAGPPNNNAPFPSTLSQCGDEYCKFPLYYNPYSC
jgi:hypothetical protein